MQNSSIIPVSVLPAQFQPIFSNFTHFNKVQSVVFDQIFNSDDTLVINSPTGSGKTVLLELAIVRELCKLKEKSSFENTKNSFSELHVIYFCPLKAIVLEKLKEWTIKFAPFNIVCKDLTGDTPLMPDYGSETFVSTNILLVTPEKFDHSIRTNRPFRQFINMIQLVLIDEIHILSDKNRGDILEATITRMKMLRKTKDNLRPLRFIGISATAPNVDDIAKWLNKERGIGINIDHNFRPVKLEKIVLGYDNGRLNQNSDYRFDIMLSYHIENLIRKYANNKPSLVFCSTRKSVEFTANVLASSNYSFFNDLDHRTRFEVECTKFARQCFENFDNKLITAEYFSDIRLKKTMKSGVAFHHLGLPEMDRKLVERLYSESLIPVLISTSSLAMGVNLPAHLVIIKNTVQYNSGISEEYESSQVLQMIGRAGRPQFDTEAKAIIMTKTEKKPIYERLMGSNFVIESNLHLTLDVQMAVEIVLKTVNSINDALKWVKSSFLFRRIVSNPQHYKSKIPPNDYEAAIPVIKTWCKNTVKKLEEIDLVVLKNYDKIESTKLAKIVIKNSLAIKSFEKIIKIIQKSLDIEHLLLEISNFDELNKEIVIRNSEKTHLNELNKGISFPIHGKIKNAQHKINCILQSTLSCLTLDQALIRDSNFIQRSSVRVVKCLTDVLEYLCGIYSLKAVKKSPSRTDICAKTLISSVLLLKSIRAKLWFNSHFLTKQLKNIGPVMSKKLFDRGYDSFSNILEANGRDIEFCIGRKPPFGSLLIDEVRSFPKYEIKFNRIVCNIELNDISYENIQQWSIDIKAILSKNNENRFLKPNEHQVSIIIFCETCDEVIIHARMLDIQLSNTFFSKNVFIVRTHINSEKNIQDEDDPNEPSEKKSKVMSKNDTIEKSKNVEQKEKLASFSRYFNDLSCKDSNNSFHCTYYNALIHCIKISIISESFVGIDQEDKFNVQFRSTIQLNSKRSKKIISESKQNKSDIDFENLLNEDLEFFKELSNNL